jgi:hypothetical protein
LVGKTAMPKPEQLPDSLRNFAFINAAPVDTGRDFHRDLNRVMATINSIIGLPLDTVERAAILPDPANNREAGAIAAAPTENNADRETDANDRQTVSPTAPATATFLVGGQCPARSGGCRRQ